MSEQKKKISIWLPILLSLVMVVGMTIGYQLRDNTAGGKFLGLSGRSSVQELVSLINNKYVDPVASDSIDMLVADALLSHLDPHSAYIPASDLAEFNDDIAGSFMGIGIEFQMMNDTVNVMNVFKDGPSFKAGLQVGDQLLKANDSITLYGKNISADWVRSKIRGEEGSAVKVTVLRNNKQLNLNIIRGVIPVSPIDAAYMIQPSTGYIKIDKFSERTYETFMASLEKLQKAGMKSLVLDLRGNGGGLLQEAVFTQKVPTVSVTILYVKDLGYLKLVNLLCLSMKLLLLLVKCLLVLCKTGIGLLLLEDVLLVRALCSSSLA
jgi:carboxyl-terminal processing protease